MNNYKTETELRDEIARLRTQRDYLLSAVRRTLHENGHLADGDNCTLIVLKRAFETLVEVGATNRDAQLLPATISKMETVDDWLETQEPGVLSGDAITVGRRVWSAAVLAEREACATVCETSDRYRGEYFAAKIRARSRT